MEIITNLKMNVSVVIPVLNEKESLPELVRELEHSLSTYPVWEVLFIDDGSSDGSTEWMADLCTKNSNFKLLQFYRNYGKAAALSEGFKVATGEYIITMDADLQDDPAEIPNLISKLSDGWDLVSGWKKTRHDPLNKTLPSKVFNFVTRLMTGVKIHDFNCGLKGYKQAVVKSIEVYGGRHRYIPALAGQQKFKITEIVVNHRARQFGETKYGGRRCFSFNACKNSFLDISEPQMSFNLVMSDSAKIFFNSKRRKKLSLKQMRSIFLLPKDDPRPEPFISITGSSKSVPPGGSPPRIFQPRLLKCFLNFI